MAAKAGCATTLGYGPRYLHSTGQLHKGGPNTGVFLIVTAGAIRRPADSRRAIFLRRPGNGAGAGRFRVAGPRGPPGPARPPPRPRSRSCSNELLAESSEAKSLLYDRRCIPCILRHLPTWQPVRRQSTLGRANAALERGRGAEAAQLLTPLLRSGPLPAKTSSRSRGARRSLAAAGRPRAGRRRPRPPARRHARTDRRRAARPRSGGCTAASPLRAASSRARSRCTRAR